MSKLPYGEFRSHYEMRKAHMDRWLVDNATTSSGDMVTFGILEVMERADISTDEGHALREEYYRLRKSYSHAFIVDYDRLVTSPLTEDHEFDFRHAVVPALIVYAVVIVIVLIIRYS